MNRAPEWTPEMDATLRREWGRLSADELATVLDVTPGQLRWRGAYLGLKAFARSNQRQDERTNIHEDERPDLASQDDRFTEAMKAAIAAGRESAPIGIDRTYGTRRPVYVPHRKNEPFMTSPAASCTEAGE